MTKQTGKAARDFRLKDANISGFCARFDFVSIRVPNIRGHLLFWQDDRLTIDGVHNRINMRGQNFVHDTPVYDDEQ